MTNEDHIQKIAERGLAPYYTRRQKVERAALYVCVFLVVALVVGFFVNKLTTSNLAACTNANLAQRNGPSQADAASNAADSKASSTNAAAQFNLLKAEVQVLVLDAGDQPKGAADYAKILVPALQVAQEAQSAFAVESAQHTRTLAADQAQRDLHPLGKC